MNDEIKIRRIDFRDHEEIVALLGRSMNRATDKRFGELFRWKHVSNPFGASYGLVATSGERLVGVRLFMHWRFRDGETVVNAARAVDTATDPDFMGRGLFRRLTLTGLDDLRDLGVDLIFNTPNDMSRPGYLKMGWQEIGQIPTSIRPRSLLTVHRVIRSRVPANHWSLETEIGVPASEFDWRHVSGSGNCRDTGLLTDLSAEVLAWRFSLPSLGYRVMTSDGDRNVVVFRLRERGASRELVECLSSGTSPRAVRALRSHLVRGTHADHVVGTVDRNSPLAGATIKGPRLTAYSLNGEALRPLAQWKLRMLDVELF